MTTKYIVNNVTGQTITGNLTINGNLTITGTTNTRPYKVYTALLTQNGGDDIGYLQNGELTVGVTYKINFNSDGMDFTNVGAPNNEVDTYFVATGTTPNDWGKSVDTENILEYNLGAPVVTVLENTIGNIWFQYSGEGEYRINSNSLFTANKTYTVLQLWADDSVTNRTGLVIWESTNVIILFNRGYAGAVQDTIGSDSNPVSFLTSIEIRVYN